MVCASCALAAHERESGTSHEELVSVLASRCMGHAAQPKVKGAILPIRRVKVLLGTFR
jgi:hypothetical protein